MSELGLAFQPQSLVFVPFPAKQWSMGPYAALGTSSRTITDTTGGVDSVAEAELDGEGVPASEAGIVVTPYQQ
jgi:hypothetical protein